MKIEQKLLNLQQYLLQSKCWELFLEITQNNKENFKISLENFKNLINISLLQLHH